MNTAKKGRIHKGGIITRVVSRNWLATMVSTYIYDIMYLYIYLFVFIYDTMYIYYIMYIYILFVCTTYILQYVYIYNVLSIDWINQGY